MAQSVLPRRGRSSENAAPLPDRDILPRARRSSMRVRNRRQPAVLPLDLTLLVAAAIGLLVAVYLAFVDLTGGATLCLAGSDCDVVRASSYGRVAGLPVALLGVGYFAAVAAASAIPSFRRRGL